MSESKAKAMVQDALDRVRDLYAANLAEHGTTSKSVGWRDEQSQLLRFEKLALLIGEPSEGDRFSVADWGCGYGAMCEYLEGRYEASLASYTGYDVSPEMVAAAKGVGSKRGRFIVGSLPDQSADYTFVSGTFNVRMQASDDAWSKYVEETLVTLYSNSRRGVAFNLLSSYVDWRTENLHYADPCHMFDFCKRRLSRYVTLVHDYSLYEWTMIVHRDPSEDVCAIRRP